MRTATTKLTPRERQLLDLLSAGHSQKTAAKVLGIKHGTARKHVMAARNRTGARSTTQLLAMLAAAEKHGGSEE